MKKLFIRLVKNNTMMSIVIRKISKCVWKISLKNYINDRKSAINNIFTMAQTRISNHIQYHVDVEGERKTKEKLLSK